MKCTGYQLIRGEVFPEYRSSLFSYRFNHAIFKYDQFYYSYYYIQTIRYVSHM